MIARREGAEVLRLGAAPPPQNLEAERGALGSMLLDNDAIDEVSGLVSAGDYYRDSHAVIHAGILAVYEAHGKADAILLIEELTRAGRLVSAGGEAYVAEVIESVPHAANARYYAGIVREKAVARRLIEDANASLRDAYSNLFTSDELADRAQSRALGLSGSARRDALMSNADVLAEGMDMIDRRGPGVSGVCTGWMELDTAIDGLQAGHVVLLAGRPGMGKSTGALNVAIHAAVEDGVPTLLALLEAGPADLAVRQLAHASGLPSYAIKNSKGLTPEEMVRLGEAYERLRVAPLSVLPGSQSVSSIAAAARRMRRAGPGLGLIIIDYIQRVRWDGDGRASRQEQVSRISRAVSDLALALDVPILALAQLNRGVEDRKSCVPMLSDLRESGDLEADASEVVLMHRPEYYDPSDRPGVIELIVAKNRNGALTRVECDWSPATFRIRDKAPGPAPAAAGPGAGPAGAYYPPADDF